MARVMVVEDEAIVAQDLACTLGRLGHEVVATAASGREAVAAAVTLRPDLMLMDVRIQGDMDGIEAAREVRLSQDVPVVYLTAFSDEETARRAGESEAYGFIVKPFHDGDLRGAIDVALHRHRAERRLRARESWQRLAALGTLTAGVAHEMNSPLASALSNCAFALEELAAADQALATGQASPEARARVREAMQAIDDARLGTRRVAAIVAQLGRLARAEAGRRELVELAAVARTAATFARDEISRRARFSVDAAPGLFVRSTASQLEQVMVNLLRNAAQAIPEGAPAAHEISLRVLREGGKAVIEVRDTGCGMTQEVLARVFEPFFTTRPVGSGMGLGLSLCHGVITGHGGELTVSSEPGKGSTFRALLPEAAPRPPPGLS